MFEEYELSGVLEFILKNIIFIEVWNIPNFKDYPDLTGL